MRIGLMALAALGLVGTTIELVFIAHWSGSQWLVWPVLLVLAMGLGILVARPGRRGLAVVRGIAVAALVFSLVGVWFHIQENLGAGPLDRHYADTWDTLAPVQQWWLAISEGVGPAPTLAPGSLAEIALALGLATIGAVRRSGIDPDGAAAVGSGGADGAGTPADG
jgi:hypothetical protein